MKRARGDALTGGSGDVNPQWLVLGSVTQLLSNSFIEEPFNIPVQRLAQRKGKSLVMEILQLQWSMPPPDTNNAAGGSNIAVRAQLATAPTGSIDPGNPRVLGYSTQNYRGAFTAGGTFQTIQINPYVVDMTDGAGHGILVGTDTLYISMNTNGFANPAFINLRIMYRWKEVGLEEYIGIVQSQQG